MRHEPTSLSGLLHAANRGDAAAYKAFLTALMPRLRAAAASRLARMGHGNDEVEDIVQDSLLAIHLKRGTWDERRPVEPWVRAIMLHKLIDHVRRRRARRFAAIGDYANVLAEPAPPRSALDGECAALIRTLPENQRIIVQQVSVEGRCAREVGAFLGMSEGAVRVALHRALKRLSAAYRGRAA